MEVMGAARGSLRGSCGKRGGGGGGKLLEPATALLGHGRSVARMVERHEANRRLRAKSFRSTDRAGALQWAITHEAAREMREEEARLESLRASLEGGAPQALLMRSNSLPVLPPVRTGVGSSRYSQRLPALQVVTRRQRRWSMEY